MADMYDEIIDYMRSIDDKIGSLNKTFSADMQGRVRRDQDSRNAFREVGQKITDSVKVVSANQNEDKLTRQREKQRNEAQNLKQEANAAKMYNRGQALEDEKSKRERSVENNRRKFYSSIKHFTNSFFRNFTKIVDENIKAFERTMRDSLVSKNEMMSIIDDYKSTLTSINKRGQYVFSLEQAREADKSLGGQGLTNKQRKDYLEIQMIQQNVFKSSLNNLGDLLRRFKNEDQEALKQSLMVQQGYQARIVEFYQQKGIRFDQKQLQEISATGIDNKTAQLAFSAAGGVDSKAFLSGARRDMDYMAAAQATGMQEVYEKLLNKAYDAVKQGFDSGAMSDLISGFSVLGAKKDVNQIRKMIASGEGMGEFVTQAMQGFASPDLGDASHTIAKALGLGQGEIDAIVSSRGNVESFTAMIKEFQEHSSKLDNSNDALIKAVNNQINILEDSQPFLEKIQNHLSVLIGTSWITKLGLGTMNMAEIMMGGMFLKDMIGGVKNGVVKEIITGVKGAFSKGLGFIKGMPGALSKGASTIGSALKGGGGVALKGGGKLLSRIPGLGALISAADFGSSAYSASQATEGSESYKEARVGMSRSAASGAGALALGKLGAMIGTAIAPGVGTAIGGAVGGLAGGIGGAVLGEEFTEPINKSFDTIKSFFADSVPSFFSETIVPAFDSAVDWIKGSFDSSIDWVQSKFTGIVDSVWDMVKTAFTTVEDVFGSALGYITEKIEKLQNIGKNIDIVDVMKGLMSEGLGTAKDIASSVGNTVKGAIGSVFGFKTGLEYVPGDNYPAYLHKGEMVLTAEEAELYRNAWKKAPKYESGIDSVGYATQENEERRKRAESFDSLLRASYSMDLSDRFSSDAISNSISGSNLVLWGDKRIGMANGALSIFDKAFNSKEFQDKLVSEGLSIHIKSGLRSGEKQAGLVKGGYGAINSAHLTGEAIDYNIVKNGRTLLAFEEPRSRDIVNQQTLPFYEMIGRLLAKISGDSIVSGHTFPHNDPNHMEIKRSMRERQRAQVEATAEGVAKGMSLDRDKKSVRDAIEQYQHQRKQTSRQTVSSFGKA